MRKKESVPNRQYTDEFKAEAVIAHSMLEFGIFDWVEASATNAALDLRLAERAPVSGEFVVKPRSVSETDLGNAVARHID